MSTVKAELIVVSDPSQPLYEDGLTPRRLVMVQLVGPRAPSRHVPVDEIYAVARQLEADGHKVDLPPHALVQHVIDTQHQTLSRNVRTSLGPLWDKMHPYQRVGVEFACSKRKAYIADEMGTGKTLQSLAVCLVYRSLWPCLIVCPSSLRYTWANQVDEWLGPIGPSPRGHVLKSSKHLTPKKGPRLGQSGPNVGDHDFLIVSHELLARPSVLAEVVKRGYKIVICDEAHKCKSHVAERSKAMIAASATSEVTLLLSGTPFSFPSEMYNQFAILYPNVFAGFFDYFRPKASGKGSDGPHYANRYCKPFRMSMRNTYQWIFKGYDRQPELAALLATFMIRRRKADVLPQLPKKVRTRITLEPLPMGQAKEIQESMKALKSGKGDTSSRNEFMELFRTVCAYKIPRVLDFIKHQIIDVLRSGDAKVIIFFHHMQMCLALQSVLVGPSTDYFVIDGSTSPQKRQEYVDAFQSTDRYKVALLSVTAASTGLTLTRASYVVFTEVMFGPDLHLQAEDRAHRIGQQVDVNIFYLMLPGSTDQINYDLIAKKDRESSIILDAAPSISTSSAMVQVASGDSMADLLGKRREPSGPLGPITSGPKGLIIKRFKPQLNAAPP